MLWTFLHFPAVNLFCLGTRSVEHIVISYVHREKIGKKTAWIVCTTPECLHDNIRSFLCSQLKLENSHSLVNVRKSKSDQRKPQTASIEMSGHAIGSSHGSSVSWGFSNDGIINIDRTKTPPHTTRKTKKNGKLFFWEKITDDVWKKVKIACQWYTVTVFSSFYTTGGCYFRQAAAARLWLNFVFSLTLLYCSLKRDYFQ